MINESHNNMKVYSASQELDQFIMNSLVVISETHSGFNVSYFQVSMYRILSLGYIYRGSEKNSS